MNGYIIQSAKFMTNREKMAKIKKKEKLREDQINAAVKDIQVDLQRE